MCDYDDEDDMMDGPMDGPMDDFMDGPMDGPMDDGYDDMGPGPMNYGPMNFRNRYNNAYGNYKGGYGPGGGYGPPRFNSRFFGPPGPPGPGPFGGPPAMFGPPGPPLGWGKGFGPRGPRSRRNPADERALRYLKRCGLTKDNLKNLPSDMLQLIEPEYCGLCSMEFDSFSISRSHYLSKNHLKNQRKWLVHQNNGGVQRGKEIPLKSRDLYCELCDVHITSKVHADSHYAGKPHRSIVEGRKNPKNPFLMQKGMEQRLEQLIRREKRNLKPVEEEGEDAEETPKEIKPVPPELYCDICKTSVTCSEQMTMHLNGKRHLNKEKQHILKVMKGNTDENDQNETAQESAAGEGEDEGEQAEDGQDKYDWGNGSGNWDETTTKEE